MYSMIVDLIVNSVDPTDDVTVYKVIDSEGVVMCQTTNEDKAFNYLRKVNEQINYRAILRNK